VNLSRTQVDDVQVRDSATRPLQGEGWWKHADEPWQVSRAA
jgi:DNA-directed RNA polymerase